MAELEARQPELTPAQQAIVKQSEEGRMLLRKSLRAKHGHLERLITLPGVQPVSSLFRFAPGGRDKIIELAQLGMQNGNEDLKAWWAIYADLSAYARSIVSLDDICAGSNVTPKAFMHAILDVCYDFGQDTARLVAGMMHPEIVHQMARSAMRISGKYADTAQRDRHAFLQAQGFLPPPRGTTVNVHASANAKAAAAASTEPSVPSFAVDVGAMPTRILPPARESD
jgi:hypothetical protein